MFVYDLPPLTGLSLCTLITALFVGALYVGPHKGSREDPAVIKQRMVSVTVVTAVVPFVVSFFATEHISSAPPTALPSVWPWLGLRLDTLLPSALVSLALVALLFTGPLLMMFQAEELPTQRRYPLAHVKADIFSLVFLRGIIFAPISEEIVFRACLIPLLYSSFHNWTLVISPLFFGIAHLHHIYEHLRFKRLKISSALGLVVFQLGYTTLFGAFSAFLFLSTGNAIGPISAHILCNALGFPDFEGALSATRSVKCAFVFGLLSFLSLLFLSPVPQLLRNSYSPYTFY